MGFRLSKIGANWGLKQKASRKLFRKLGLSGKSKWLRQLKRSFNPNRSTYYPQATSASSVGYQHNGRSLSQLTGGV